MRIAASGVPARAGLSLELAFEKGPLERREAVHEEQAVDVIDLVAESPREELGPFVSAGPAVDVSSFDDDSRRANR